MKKATRLLLCLSILTQVHVSAQIKKLQELYALTTCNEQILQSFLLSHNFRYLDDQYIKDINQTVKIYAVQKDKLHDTYTSAIGYVILKNKTRAIIYFGNRNELLDVVIEGMEQLGFKMDGPPKGVPRNPQVCHNKTHEMVTTFLEGEAMRILIFKNN